MAAAGVNCAGGDGMNWYYLKNGQCVGPVSAAEIIRLAREGQLLRNDRVRHDEYGPWMRAAQVPTLRLVVRAQAASVPDSAPGYFTAHWRGNLPLRQSFWLTAFLPLLLLSGGFFAAVRAEAIELPGGFAVNHLALLIAAAAVLLMPWQFVGAWRAAERRLQHGEDLPASAACFALTAVVAQLFGLFAWSVPFLMPAPPPVVAASVSLPSAKPSAPTPTVSRRPSTGPAAPTALQLLATTEPFATLRERAPVEYRAAQALVEQAQRDGAGTEAALAQAATLVQQLAERYMALAPDAALSGYVAVLLSELQALQAKDAALCTGFAYPRGSSVRLAEHVAPEVLQAERAALVEVIRAAALRPQARASFEDVQRELVGVYRRVAERHGSGVYRLDKPYQTGFDDAQLCQVTIDIYTEFQKLPPEERGRVLRFTLGS